ncbi:Uncharacterised protein [Mycobacteroides abscessus subsp. abscessus]|nr:Uncharacterised protein [Mycobacteroides abscessus subsp. abscessus]
MSAIRPANPSGVPAYDTAAGTLRLAKCLRADRESASTCTYTSKMTAGASLREVRRECRARCACLRSGALTRAVTPVPPVSSSHPAASSVKTRNV